jgi:cytochrome c-type biogenesis protein CcmH/NrfG
MTQTIEALFQEGVERYQAGEPVEDLIPVFQTVCERAPKNSPAWTCLAWLYLLSDKSGAALKAAQKAVKLNPEDAQARINLAIASLEADQKGVRQHVELARQLMVVPELREEVQQNFEDGLKRKPDWQALLKVHSWIFEG